MASFWNELKRLLEGNGRAVGLALGLSVGSVLIDLVCLTILPIFVTAALIGSDVALTPIRQFVPWVDSVSFPVLSLFTLALFMFRAIYMLALGSTLAWAAESIRKLLIVKIVKSDLDAGYESVLKRSVAGGITSATVYTNSFIAHVVLPGLRLIADVLTLTALLAVLAFVEWKAVAAIGVVLFLVAAAYYLGIRGASDRQSRHVANLQAALTGHVSQALHAPREIRIFAVQRFFMDRIRMTLRSLAVAQTRLASIYWFPRALGELTLISLCIVYLAISGIQGGDAAAVMSQLSLFGYGGLRMLPAFSQSMVGMSQLRSGRHVTHLLAQQLRCELKPIPHSERAELAQVDGCLACELMHSIMLRDVSFHYASASRRALEGISLTIRRGQSVGVVGPSGSGKSTLADILLGLLRPTSGEMLVNDRSVLSREEDWWKHVGFVPQSPYIADDTLTRNIAYGISDGLIDESRIRQAVSLAQLDSVVSTLPNGLDTVLGEHGVRLSGGQRQRVAIARALYRQRDFLVLDEATSALDSETETEIIRAIDALKGKVTTFIIAHRHTTLRNCDQIIELREGRIVASGAVPEMLSV